MIRKLRFLKKLVLAPLSQARGNNICLWHAGRCGSTVLAHMLKDDGRFNWRGEFYERASKQAERGDGIPRDLWVNATRELRYDMLCSGIKSYGFEFKLWHAERFELALSEVYAVLNRLGVNKHIVLERENYLRIYVSGRVRSSTGITHLSAGQTRSRTMVKVNPSEALREIRICSTFYDSLRSLLPNDTLWLTYERDVEDSPRIAYRRILSWLQYAPRNVPEKLIKTNPYALHEIVSNWNELVEALNATSFSWMTDE